MRARDERATAVVGVADEAAPSRDEREQILEAMAEGFASDLPEWAWARKAVRSHYRQRAVPALDAALAVRGDDGHQLLALRESSHPASGAEASDRKGAVSMTDDLERIIRDAIGSQVGPINVIGGPPLTTGARGAAKAVLAALARDGWEVCKPNTTASDVIAEADDIYARWAELPTCDECGGVAIDLNLLCTCGDTGTGPDSETP